MATNNAANTYITPDANNIVLQPSQPAFSAYLGSDDDNQTGAGTVFRIGDTDVGTALTEIFDQNADFTTGASGGAYFTAPVTGRYVFIAGITVDSVSTSNYEFNKVETSNRRYIICSWDGSAVVNAADEIFTGAHFICDMDAADTAKFFTVLYNLGGDTVDVQGSATLETYFMGYLLV